MRFNKNCKKFLGNLLQFFSEIYGFLQKFLRNKLKKRPEMIIENLSLQLKIKKIFETSTGLS